MRQKTDLLTRQARVGIFANPVQVTLPTLIPREVMTRWPDLRSRRRLRKHGQLPDSVADHVQDDRALDAFRNELRKDSAAVSDWFPGLSSILGTR